jgi:hypothetical protein
MGTILAAVSAMTALFQQGNQSLSPSCTASQPSTLSGWLTVVYLRITVNNFQYVFGVQLKMYEVCKRYSTVAYSSCIMTYTSFMRPFFSS